MEIARFYEFPRYYDLALARPDLDDEVSFFASALERHARIPMRRVLEPACGSGIIALALAKRGYEVLGYDYAPRMVEFCNDRIARTGLGDVCTVEQADMRDAVYNPPFDGALICVNSLGYCVEDHDVRRHFAAMNRSLRLGGVYITEVSTACIDLANELRLIERNAGDGCRVDVRWTPDGYDRERKRRHITLHLDVDDQGRTFSFTEGHTLRLWSFEDLTGFAREAGFALEGAYDQSYKPADLTGPITGERGALYYVLVKERDIVVS